MKISHFCTEFHASNFFNTVIKTKLRRENIIQHSKSMLEKSKSNLKKCFSNNS